MNDKSKIALLYEEVRSKIPTKRTTPDELMFDDLKMSWTKGFVTFCFFGENLDKVAHSDRKTPRKSGYGWWANFGIRVL
jgi:hypothetical protein